jgi:hypothetical protein
MNTGKCLLLSAGIVALSTGWVAAAPAVARDFVSLRSGPAKAPWPYGAYSSAFVSYWRNPYGFYYRLNLLCALPPTRQECVAARPPIP